MLATYDELWALGWKSQLERMMVEYFETYESETNKVLDWGYAARMVIQFFYQLQRAAQSPNDGIKFRGSTRVLVKNERLHIPQDWVDFIHEAFIPYCVDAFSTESLWTWCQKKLVIPPLPIFGVGKRAVQDKGKKVVVGNGTPDTQKGKADHKAKPVKSAPPPSTTKYCVVDAFKFVGIKGVLDERSTKLCKAGECKFTHVSEVPPKTYGHGAVFSGVNSALSRQSVTVKDAWHGAMQGRGRELFHGPFVNESR
jgi:hypothetical protein